MRPLLLLIGVALAALLIPAGCDDDKAAAIPKPTGTMTITVTIVPDAGEMQRLRDQAGATADRVLGFATWRTGPGGRPVACHIYVPPILRLDDWRAVETWVHEIGHCVAGAWH